VKLLLDEHFSPDIARQLRARGHDVVAARERPELHALPDRELLAVARHEHRVIVTENLADFIDLHRQSLLRRDPHPGILFTSAKRFPRNRRAIGRLVQALDKLLSDPSALDGRTLWLSG
jgi:predicted nuclease of predicted toxin-antitoxin system